jgi:uncharacterized membrane protein YhfC
MDKYAKIKRQIQAMSKWWVADATISRIAKVSLQVIRGILLYNDYTPTPRIIGKIYKNLDEFLSDLTK